MEELSVNEIFLPRIKIFRYWGCHSYESCTHQWNNYWNISIFCIAVTKFSPSIRIIFNKIMCIRHRYSLVCWNKREHIWGFLKVLIHARRSCLVHLIKRSFSGTFILISIEKNISTLPYWKCYTTRTTTTPYHCLVLGFSENHKSHSFSSSVALHCCQYGRIIKKSYRNH